MNTKEIKPLEIIKVLLLTDDDVEEPTYARVMKNKIKERSLLVLFLNDNGKLDRDVSEISYDTLLEHWKGETNIWDVSGVEPMSEDETDSEDETLGGFIVPDDENDLPAYTNDRREMDRRWGTWTPDTPQGKSYKDIVDRIERKYC
jgi:hypothetical protein